MTPRKEVSLNKSAIAGYQQVYIVKHKNQDAPKHNEVFFQCGDWCYDGFVKLEFEGKEMTVKEVPNIPRVLHRHQDDLSFLCLAESVLTESKSFAPALKIIEEANKFILEALTSPNVLEEVQRLGKEKSSNVNNFGDGYFFELVANIPSQMNDVECICCKTYVKEALVCVVFFEGIFYCVLRDANENQPLLDISFPDIMREGSGVTLAMYDKEEAGGSDSLSWVKLSLWESVSIGTQIFQDIQPSSTVSLSTNTYGQSYCILKPNKPDRSNRDVMFRFGSWCYSGQAALIPNLCIDDIHHVIPALRAQQNQLSFLCHASEMSIDNIFTAPLTYIAHITKLMEREVITAENFLIELEKRSIINVDDHPENMFFQFETFANDILDTSHIDCIATKSYRPNGLVVMSVYFRGTFYVCLGAGDENQPLLDSSFPCIIPQGKGYQIKLYPSGISGWPELRKLSLWMNVESAVLEEEPDKNCVRIESDTEVDNEEHEIIHRETTIKGKELATIKEKEEVDKPPIKQNESKQKTFRKVYVAESKPNVNVDNTPFSKEAKASRPLRHASNIRGFHHLAPLKTPSKLEQHVKATKNNTITGQSSQWHSDGRPIKI